jgi:hypothetical protein
MKFYTYCGLLAYDTMWSDATFVSEKIAGSIFYPEEGSRFLLNASSHIVEHILS